MDVLQLLMVGCVESKFQVQQKQQILHPVSLGIINAPV
jgi:hypothetical protein